MKIKAVLRHHTISIDVISILLIILFSYNICWLKTAYYFEVPTVWNKLYRICQLVLFIYLLMLVLIKFAYNIINEKKRIMDSGAITICSLLLYELVVTYYCNIFSENVVYQVAIWPLCFLVGTMYLDKSILNRRNIIIVNASIIIYGLIAIQSIISHLSGRGNIGGVIFPVYGLIAMCSFLLIQKKSFLKSLLIIYSTILILCTTKRTGILCMIIGLFMYYIFETIWNKKSITIYLKVILKIILGGILVISIINYFEIDILDRFYALSQDGGSGRDGIWQEVYLGFKNSDIYYKIFGHGFNAVGRVLKPQGRGILAHNDYLEYLYDFGVIGVILVLVFLINIINKLYKFVKTKNSLAPVLVYVICCFLILSMFSYLMSQSILINMFALFLGMANNSQWTMKDETKCDYLH